MMKVAIFLLFVVLIASQYSRAQTQRHICTPNGVIKSSTESLVSSVLSTVELDCTSVSARGADASCPSGYKATGCACGMDCESWDIRDNAACHCQCENIESTSAQCCRIGLVG
ncbi:PREDICTED: resistin-like [Gekko japonicus]|uniref:Resistin-like n=1 Tax=Gekko japonicus TaxID=146911 RepID=A0ABM1KIE6_GEKJA|nr:PREDICTED: resistin-like [Gekko japonicus]